MRFREVKRFEPRPELVPNPIVQKIILCSLIIFSIQVSESTSFKVSMSETVLHLPFCGYGMWYTYLKKSVTETEMPPCPK